MKKLPLVIAIALSFAVLVASSGAAASPRLGLVEAKGPKFPTRTFVLQLAGNHRLTAGDVRVTENGNSVVNTTLVPAAKASPKTFGVVLVLDKSWSMHGAPIAAAVNAAQAFANQRNPNERLGLIEFNRNAKTVLALTTAPDKIAQALASIPKLATGTHIFDAVAQAEQMLTKAGVTAGSIVVLSDGADTGSTKTIDQVANTATAFNLRIYTVGLEDTSYDSRTLRDLAQRGHGVYAKAKTKDLAALFAQLSQNLSNEYLLQYKSLAGPNTLQRVQVQVNGLGTGVAGYRTPAIPEHTTAPAPYKPSIADRIWGSWITIIILALFAASVVAFLLIAILQPRRSGLPARMAEFVSIRNLQRDKGQGAQDAPPRPDFWERFEETLEIAEIRIEPEWIVAGTFAVMALTFLLIYAVTGSPWWSLFALVIPYLSREWVVRTLARRRYRFAEQLPDALQVVASALRSGHSFAGALAVVVESASEPMKSEMQRVVADEQLGVPIQDSLGVVATRMASRDVEQLALVAQLQREAGGDAAEVVDRVAETVRERFDLRRLIQTLTMQGRMSRWIVSALPIVVVLAVELENPHYFHPLTSTLGGRIVLGFAAAWAIAGSFVIKKIVEIEV